MSFQAFSIFSLFTAAFCALTFCLTFLYHQYHAPTPGNLRTQTYRQLPLKFVAGAHVFSHGMVIVAFLEQVNHQLAV